jgi:cation transport ATPase
VHDGSFEQEPGAGATAIVEGKRVAVGNLEWVSRYLYVLYMTGIYVERNSAFKHTL